MRSRSSGSVVTFELGLVDAHEVGPALRASVDRLEHLRRLHPRVGIVEIALERGDRLRLTRIAGQRGGVVLDRTFDVVQLRLVQIAELDAQRDRFIDRCHEAEPPLVKVDKVVPAPLLAVEPFKRVDRVGALGRDLEHLLPGLDRVVGPL